MYVFSADDAYISFYATRKGGLAEYCEDTHERVNLHKVTRKDKRV